MKPVRLKDIAQELGLSIVTISKVLRNHPDIAEKTRDRVTQRMKELNYQPNLAARSLSTGRTCTVGLIVPDLLHPFFAQIATTISARLRKQRYGLIISSSEEDPELELQEIDQLLARRVDVILIASAQKTPENLKRMQDQNVPYVLLDRRFTSLRANFVGVDDEAAGFMATHHLHEQGCKRIAHISGPEVSTAIGREKGYMDALAANSLLSPPGYIVSAGSSGDHRGERGGYDCALKLISIRPRPDGIFCFNDPVALGAMRAILDSGLRVPEDIAIVGCGNLSYSDFLRVPLSSIDQSSELIGEKAATMALSLAKSHKSSKPKSLVISPKLIVRKSSQRMDFQRQK